MASTFELRRRVEFCETDAAGLVHFSNYLRYMEATEHAFFRSLGASVHPTPPVPGLLGWPRVSASCEYFQPLRFEEEFVVRLIVTDRRDKSLSYRFEFYRCASPEPAADTNAHRHATPIAIGRMTAVCVCIDDSTGRLKARAIPPELAARIVPETPNTPNNSDA